MKENSLNLNKLCVGDKRAWSSFVGRYSKVLYAAVAKLMAAHAKDFHEHDLNEVVQNILLKLVKDDYKLLKSYDAKKASAVTWLNIIARTTAIDYLRSRRHQYFYQDGDEQELMAKEDSPDIRVLPENLLSERETLVLHFLYNENRKVVDVATYLGVKAQTVRSTKHKALTKIRNYLSLSTLIVLISLLGLYLGFSFYFNNVSLTEFYGELYTWRYYETQSIFGLIALF